MIDTHLTQLDCVEAAPGQEVLQQYVHALLARQHSLDLLESIEQQVSQVWTTIHRLLESSPAARAASQAVRAARAAQAVQAKNAYRALEKRREETIAALHQAERRAHASLQNILLTGAKRATETARKLVSHSRNRSNSRTVCRATTPRIDKEVCSERN